MYRFPHDLAYLPDTRLPYVNLAGILSHGKRDRTARVAGFVVIQLGERCYLIFLREGEPFQAARLEPNHRGRIALAEVLRIAAAESERGEAGHIGFFGAPEEQLRVMISTLIHPPLPWEEGVDPARPDHLFPALRNTRFSGVVEIRRLLATQYLVFEEGAFRTGFFLERAEGVPVVDRVRGLFAGADGRFAVTLFPPLGELPEQASPWLVELYRRLLDGLLHELSVSMGAESTLTLARTAHARARMRAPVLTELSLTEEGQVSGDPVDTPRALTEGVAAWVTEMLSGADDRSPLDPSDLLLRVSRDSRFVLAEQGFFTQLPWTVPL